MKVKIYAKRNSNYEVVWSRACRGNVFFEDDDGNREDDGEE